jgi:hypothetical protein
MPDGLFQIKDWQGRQRRVRLCNCAECEARLPDYYFTMLIPSAETLHMCSACTYEYMNRGKAIARSTYLQARRAANDLPYQRRAIALALASPAWRDRAAIRAIYAECRRLTAETGIQHHVDHFYPLQGDLCCGLHVHQNLRILTASENCSKHKKHPMDESPALLMA